MTSTNATTSTRSRGWLIAGAAASVVVIGSGILLGPVLAWGHIQQLDTTTEQSADTFDRVPESVQITATTANVNVAADERDQVAVERTVEWARSEPTIEERWSDDDFAVDLRCPDGINGWLSDVCRIDYGARVPRRTPVDIELTTGDIELAGTMGDSDLSTTTGSIRGTGLAASTTSAHLTTGSADLDYATTPEEITVELTTGDVAITVPDDGTAYRIVGETTTGEREVEVATDPSSDRVIDVTSTTGDVEIAYRK